MSKSIPLDFYLRFIERKQTNLHFLWKSLGSFPKLLEQLELLKLHEFKTMISDLRFKLVLIACFEAIKQAS